MSDGILSGLLPPAFRRTREGNVLTRLLLFTGGNPLLKSMVKSLVQSRGGGGAVTPSPVTGPVASPVPGPVWGLPHPDRTRVPLRTGQVIYPFPQTGERVLATQWAYSCGHAGGLSCTLKELGPLREVGLVYVRKVMLELGGILSLPKYLCQTATRFSSPQERRID